MKCPLSLGPAERALGDSACCLLTARSCWLLGSLKSSWRTSANRVGLETTIRRSPTIGSGGVSLVVFAHRHTRWLVSLARFVAHVDEHAGTPVAHVNEQAACFWRLVRLFEC